MAPAYSPAKLEMARQVKEARLARKWSIDRASLLLGTRRQTWIRWEKGQCMPTEYAAALGELLGLPLDIFEEGDANGDPFRIGSSANVRAGASARGAGGRKAGTGATGGRVKKQ